MKRLALPDLLKGFAVFLIVPVHILEFFIDNSGRESFFGKVLLFLGGPICVPVFMMIMGYFIARNKKSRSVNLLRGIKVILLGFMLNIALNFHLLIKIFLRGWKFNPWDYIFGVDIMFLAGLSIILLSTLKMVKKGKEWVAFILFFLIIGLTGFMNENLTITGRNYILPFIGGTYSWSYFPIFPWMAYPLAGFAFYHWEEIIISFMKSRKNITVIILSCLLILVLLFFDWGFFVTIDLPVYYHHTFLYSLWATGVVILWIVLVRFVFIKYDSFFENSFFTWLGENITLFYVVQWLIIGNIATAIYQTQSIGTFVYWFTGMFFISASLTRLFEKTGVGLAK